jgi:hypothetical protein
MQSLLSDVTTAVHYLDKLHNMLPVEKKMETVITLRTSENIALLRERWKDDQKTLSHIFDELGIEKN